ncbi:MAG: hypothetical protein ACK4OP_03965 [Gemmobacter sp.]
MQREEADPKGLIREAYRIEGIGITDCRSILIDWALSLPPGLAYPDALRIVLAAHGTDPDHPMTQVLRAGLGDPPAPVRRGGRAARVPR